MATSRNPALPRHAHTFNRVRTDYPRDATIPSLFVDQAETRPDAYAVEWQGGSWTYRELAERARRGATALRARGVSEGDIVAVMIERSPEAAAAVMAILFAGAAYLPLSVDYPAERLARILNEANVHVAVYAPGEHPAVPDGVSLVTSDELSAAADEADAQWWRNRSPQDAAYVIYTSGSTGAPKGVVCPHRGQTRLARDTGDLRILADDRVLATTNLTFDISCFEMFSTLLNGACLVPVLKEDLLDTRALESVLLDQRISVMWLSTGLFHQHAHAAPGMFAGLRCLVAGGDTVGPRAVRTVLGHGRPQMFLNGYGPTENSSLSTTYLVEALSEQAERVPIGIPVAGTTAYVVREDGAIAEPGEIGELWVGGDGVALGYLKDPDKTAKHFVDDEWTPEAVRSRLYQTGDLACWGKDGVLDYLGRRDRQIKLRGYRVELDEVESVVLSHPDVSQAAVGVVGEGADELLVAAVVAHPGREGQLSRRLHDHVRDRLPSYMVPAHIARVDTLPLTSSGKVDRTQLADLAASSKSADSSDSGLRGEWEETVARIWRDVLHVDALGRDDTFFGLGGTSLRATQVTAAVQERLQLAGGHGRALIRHLVNDPSLADFAAKLRTLDDERQEEETPVDFAEESQLSPGLRFTTDAPETARDPKQVFLTGATGFLGVHLVERLLSAGVEHVHCLIRARDPQEALTRLAARMRRYGVDPEPLLDRVVPVPGELAEPHFGLPEDAWNSLTHDIDLIVHCGAQVNFVYPYSALAPTNVGGTRTVLELAGQYRIKPVHYISTITVIVGFGTAGVDRVEEDTPLDHADRISLGYPETKWVAERLIAEAGGRGLPIAIHRPYEVTGTADRGVWNTDTMMCALFRTIAETGLAPDMSLPLDFVPVDYTAEAIVHIITHQRPDGRVYHLTNPHDARLPALVERLVAMGYPVRTISYDEWTAMIAELTAKHPDHPMAPYVPLFVEPAHDSDLTVKQMYLDGTFPAFGRGNTEAALAGSGLSCPPTDADLLDTYLREFRRTGYLAPPPDQVRNLPADGTSSSDH
ncbi:amino acid adenylation domain-containing protein [Streptomyces cyaneofuscatus]|uniref:amino acid adenylation domain-containing protein n=1 Tax=Streptomyces cyaneofuscatus TaxID=66883 RepID=UPI002953708A|nr:amino acid adenylation domain-containing protein [Streptomyces cyaneofuscatus]WOP07036.1 amino acid adenylation domain-containing protein [Streptomyces cyaneofuscatus]